MGSCYKESSCTPQRASRNMVPQFQEENLLEYQ